MSAGNQLDKIGEVYGEGEKRKIQNLLKLPS